MKRFKDTVNDAINKNELPITEAALMTKVYTPQFVEGSPITYPANARIDRTDPVWAQIKNINDDLIRLSRDPNVTKLVKDKAFTDEEIKKIDNLYRFFNPIFKMIIG